ncbi:MAG: RnfABCDGE type electron transport complex subunit G [Ruminococcaceae bacterium]|nr:RnfABCDGE type electron transport complex subunit G [Oscillospiraceae bacterium]
MKKEFIKLSAVLCIITLVAAFILAGVNKVTAPAIAKAEKEAAENAMKTLLPEADTFEAVATDENLKVAKKEGVVVGFCAQVTTSGYGGDIVMMVGIDSNMYVQGIEILSQSETAGLGAKIVDNDFKKQFKNKSLTDLKVVKKDTDSPNEFKAVTGATISSRAVESGIAKAKDMVEKELKEGTK